MSITVTNPDTPILNERYRPNRIEDCILKSSTKRNFLNMVKEEEIKNMLFYGPAGSGKTTAAKAICDEIGVEWIVINASDERTLDVIRDKIRKFASNVSFNGKRKCVILDEADHLLDATQAAFRTAIEEYSSNCSFIFTCNYPNRIIDAIKSRLVSVDFGADETELYEMQGEFFTRLCGILDNEGISYSEDVVIQLISELFPDNRQILNLIEHFSSGSKQLDAGILSMIKDISIDKLVEYLKSNNFKSIRQWCADNADSDISNIYGKLYKELRQYLKPSSIPSTILTLNDFQRFDSTVPDKELHLVALCVTLMAESEWK